MAQVDNNNSMPDQKPGRYSALGPKRRPSTPKPDVHKYERLEDLLREAGYKETRIFTPERTPIQTNKQPSKPSLEDKHPLGGVVNLLSSLVRPSSRQGLPSTEQPRRPDVEQTMSPTLSSSSLAPSISRRQPNNGYPSKAHAYLKHVSSTPNLPQRRRSQSAHNSFKKSRHSNAPPLPPSWLETVARAVLFGGDHAYVGGPTTDRASSALGHVQGTIDDTRTVRGLEFDLERALTSATPRGRKLASADVRIQGGKLQLREGRSGHSQSEVSLTRVTCQSAPTSRANSRVRSGRSRNPRQKGQQPPCLARTMVENDGWMLDDQMAQRVSVISHQQVYGHRPRPSVDESDSEGEGEITLDRLLIPPKRQNSIRSLRQHLTLKDSFSDLRHTRPSTPNVEEQGEEDEDGEMSRRWHKGKTRRGIPRWN